MFKISNLLAFLFVVSSVSAQFAQLSSTIDQPNGALGTGVPITYNSIDSLKDIDFTSGGSTLTIKVPGDYFVIAAPQVGCSGCNFFTWSFTADYWTVVNGAAVANSNIQLKGKSGTTDVIVGQGVYTFKVGDKVQFFGSGVNSFNDAIEPDGEPVIPSIIYSIFKI